MYLLGQFDKLNVSKTNWHSDLSHEIGPYDTSKATRRVHRGLTVPSYPPPPRLYKLRKSPKLIRSLCLL